MDWQDIAATIVVVSAAFYVIWKVRGGRRPRKRGPDVSVAQLRRSAKPKDDNSA